MKTNKFAWVHAAGILSCLAIVVAHSGDLCCKSLSLVLGPDKVFYSNSSAYIRSSVTYYAQQEGELTPGCYVKPSNSRDISNAMKSINALKLLDQTCLFAVKGGGHHTVIGIANIDQGITMDLGDMNQTTLSKDLSIAYIEPGAKWGSVYTALDAVGRAVPGGRAADIGVGGFITGGGISYFGAAYGFGCDMVSNFEVVLANGDVVNANAHENSDLFAALKGGGNNLGIVTRFDMKTFPLGEFWGGSNYYSADRSLVLLDAFTAFTTDPHYDNKAAALLTPIYTSSVGFITTATFAYTEAITNPSVYVNFTTNIPPILSQTKISTLLDFAITLGANSPDNLRQTSISATVKPNATLLRQIYALWNATVPLVASAQNLVYALTYQPLPVNMLNAGPAAGGNVLGLNSLQGPLVVLTLTTQYTSQYSDALIEETTRSLFASIEALAAQTDDLIPWIYINYADAKQDVIPSYGAINVAKLRAVSKKFDPTGVFQRLQPGGFKLW